MPVTRSSIAVVDSNRLFRAGLISLLGSRTALPIGEACDVAGLSRLAEKGERFDLVLADASHVDDDASNPVVAIRTILPEARIAMLADRFDAEQLRRCLAAGAHGYLLKTISSETLTASLNLILLGEKIVPTPLADMYSQETAHAVAGMAQRATPQATGTLSERELEILHCLVDGDSNKRIANRLRIAEATVKVHLKSILRKTNAANRTQAAIWAYQRGVAGKAGAASVGHEKLGVVGRVVGATSRLN